MVKLEILLESLTCTDQEAALTFGWPSDWREQIHHSRRMKATVYNHLVQGKGRGNTHMSGQKEGDKREGFFSNSRRTTRRRRKVRRVAGAG